MLLFFFAESFIKIYLNIVFHFDEIKFTFDLFIQVDAFGKCGPKLIKNGLRNF